MYRMTIALLMLLGSMSVVAQTKYDIKGTIADKETTEAVEGATVQLLSLPDSAFVKGAVADLKGTFSLKDIRKAKYALKISFIGYVTKYVDIDLNGRKGKTVDLGKVEISDDDHMLGEALVTANAAKVQVSGDSLVYNASAYRVPEGSTLEALLKLLPGAQVDENGKITINGKEVKKILLDGKEFFVGDMNTALQNIPTSIIDKLKHYDEKSDMAKVTGIDDGEEKPVIDVRIKKGMNFGYNANADAGYGTDDRYMAKVTFNEFTEKMKNSIVANAGNVGGRSTPGRGSSRGRGSNGGNGLTADKSVGYNLNYDDRKYLQMDGNIRWNHSDSESLTKQSSESFVSRSGAFSNSRSQQMGRNNGWNAEYRIEWKPTEQWNIQLRPTASISTNDRLSSSVSGSYNHDPYLYVSDPLDLDTSWGDNDTIRVNSRQNGSVSYSRNRNIGASLQVNRKLGSEGRNLTLRLEGQYSDTQSNDVSNNRVHLYKVKDQQGNDSTYYTNRYNMTPGKTKNFSAQLSYSEPIFKGTFLQFSYRFQYRTNYSDRKTYDFSSLGAAFGNGVEPGYRTWDEYLANVPGDFDDYLNKSLSRYSEYTNLTHDLNLTLRFQRTNYNLSLGVRYVPQTSHYKQDYRGRFVDTVRTTVNITPTMQFRYRFSRQHTLNMSYHAQMQHPSITQLLDITDDSNPLNISKGNPALKPAFTNTFQLQYNNNIFARRQNISANVNFQTTTNSISNMVTYNENTGGRVTQPENINGNWSIRGDLTLSSALDKEANWNVSSTSNVNYNHHVSYISLNRTSSSEKNTTKSTTASERLAGSYRNRWLEVEVNGRASLTSARNELQSSANRDTWNYSYGCSFNVKLPWEMTIDTSVNQSSRRGFSDAAYNTDELIWNAQISQSLMSRKRLVVSLQIYDILRQQSSFSRQISANRRNDTERNAINSYAMLHVIYQLRNFGGKNGRVGGGNRGGSFGGGNRGGSFGGGNRRRF